MKGKRFRRHFLTGILVLTPALVSTLLITYIFNRIDNVLSPLIFEILERYAPDIRVPTFVVSVVSVLLIGLGIFFVGVLTENYIGKKVIDLADRALSRTPLIRGIYTAVKQFLDAFRIGSDKRFHKVVAVEYPRTDMWVLGFLTSDVGARLRDAITGKGPKLMNIFIPTTPNPTSGYLIMVDESQVRELPLTIEQAIKYIVSAGVLQNEDSALAKKLGAAIRDKRESLPES